MVRPEFHEKCSIRSHSTTGCCQWPENKKESWGTRLSPMRHMEQQYNSAASNGEFVWPGLTLFFSLLVSTSCIGLFTYVLLLFVGF